MVRDGALPANINYRAEFHFMAGWIALRFLNDPATALEHFAHVDDGSDRSGRAGARRLLARPRRRGGRSDAECAAYYEAAARHPTAYYGQLARARLGLGEIALRPPPELDARGLRHVRTWCMPRTSSTRSANANS